MQLARKSIGVRFVVSLAGNGVRAAASFAAGVLVARSLGVEDYGAFAFLLATFTSIRPLLDLGVSNAFFTFLCQPGRSYRHVVIYGAWLGIQFVVMTTGIGALFPDAFHRWIWQGYPRGLVMLAFVACFFQLQVWGFFSQVGESSRLTWKVQVTSVSVGVIHLAIIGLLIIGHLISARTVFCCILIEYLVVACLAAKILLSAFPARTPPAAPGEPWSAVVQQYWLYSGPLALSAVANALYQFGDCWLLQHFGGPRSQGLFQIANQFATISLFATTSVLQVLWKELANAVAQRDVPRVHALYMRASRCGTMVAAAASGFLIPWTGEIVATVLGEQYREAVPILSLLFFYPIHQSLGQITGILVFAAGETGLYTRVATAFMVLGVTLSYFALAPPTAAFMPGLGLGGLGIAAKVVLLNAISANILSFMVCRRLGFRFEWAYQVAVSGTSIALGVLVKFLVTVSCGLHVQGIATLLLALVVGGAMYTLLQILLVATLPGSIGLTRSQLRSALSEATHPLTTLTRYSARGESP